MNRVTKTKKEEKLPKNTKNVSILAGICNLILAAFPEEGKQSKQKSE